MAQVLAEVAGLRALTRSRAREYGSRGIHVVHVSVDTEAGRARVGMEASRRMRVQDVAGGYGQRVRQPRLAWTRQLDVSPMGAPL